MNCRNCSYESETEFDFCPKCRTKQLTVFTDKSKPELSKINKSGDTLKGFLYGGLYGLVINAILTTFLFLILMMVSGFINPDIIYIILIILVFHIGVAYLLGKVMVKLFTDMGLNKSQISASIITYVFVTIFFLLTILGF